jgi:hypothetical protein
VLKLAVTVTLPVTVSTQVDVPLHPPDQPVNVDPEEGVAVNVTAVWSLKLAVQVDPQLIPEGLLLTAPEPTLVTVTENVCVGVGDGEELPPQADRKSNAEEINTRGTRDNERRKILTCESSSGLHFDRVIWMRNIPLLLYQHAAAKEVSASPPEIAFLAGECSEIGAVIELAGKPKRTPNISWEGNLQAASSRSAHADGNIANFDCR